MSAGDGYFPVALRLAGRPVTIVGGDAEAEMKAAKLIRCGAKLKLVSAAATPGILEYAASGLLEHVNRAYRNGDLSGAIVAFVCDRRFASEAANEAADANILLNVVDDIPHCDFIAVAYFERDGLQISVHSSGKSAALARRIRERLESRYGAEYAALVRTLGELRPEIKQILKTPRQRRAFWLDFVNGDLLDRVETETVSPADLKAEALGRAVRVDAEWSRT